MKALVPIADGSEELEAVTIINILRRADIEVDVASVSTNKSIQGSRGIIIEANKHLTECQHIQYDLIALPGGLPGAEHLRDSEILIDMLKAQKKEGRKFAAICASPAIVLEHHGLLDNLNACCYPGFKLKTEHQAPENCKVFCSNNLITSLGPATAMEFALKLVESLKGVEVATKISKGLLYT